MATTHLCANCPLVQDKLNEIVSFAFFYTVNSNIAAAKNNKNHVFVECYFVRWLGLLESILKD